MPINHKIINKRVNSSMVKQTYNLIEIALDCSVLLSNLGVLLLYQLQKLPLGLLKFS